MSEVLDKSFIDVEEAKEFLGVPLFGAISKITTQEDVHLEHDKIRWMYSLTALTGIVVIVITVAITNLIR